jgi:hypothetical protein
LQEYEFFTRIFVRHQHATALLDESLCMVRKHPDTKTSDFNEKQTAEMYRSFYEANLKIVSVLLEEGKMTQNLEDFFYKDHKRYITYSKKLSFEELAVNFKDLTLSYLEANGNRSRVMRFRLGYFFYNMLPVHNFFMVYEINNPFVKWWLRNYRRAMKIMGKKGYASYALNKIMAGEQQR